MENQTSNDIVEQVLNTAIVGKLHTSNHYSPNLLNRWLCQLWDPAEIQSVEMISDDNIYKINLKTEEGLLLQ